MAALMTAFRGERLAGILAQGAGTLTERHGKLIYTVSLTRNNREYLLSVTEEGRAPRS